MKRDWIQSFSATQIFPRDMTRSVFTVEDVAQGLGKRCRFTGQCQHFYSVAEHSVLGAEALLESTGDKQLAAAFLMHDVSEAFLPDVPTPLKHFLSVELDNNTSCNWSELESLHTLEILERFGLGALLPAIDSPLIHEMDLAMLQAERDFLHGPPPMPWGILTPRAAISLRCLAPLEAVAQWRSAFQKFCAPLQDLKGW